MPLVVPLDAIEDRLSSLAVAARREVLKLPKARGGCFKEVGPRPGPEKLRGP